jgi:hypothetical protein
LDEWKWGLFPAGFMKTYATTTHIGKVEVEAHER